MNKLYFMGMGMDYTEKDIEMKGSDVGNYRIRTTFHDGKGDVIFVEFSRWYQRNEKGNNISSIKLGIDFQFNKTISEDCNESSIKIDRDKLNGYDYTKQDIVRYLNDTFGTKFEDIEVLDRCFSKFDCDECCGDKFTPNYEEIEQAKKIDKYFYDYEKNVREKEFPNHSAYFNDDVFKVILHYNCYNDIVEIPNVFEYDFDYQAPAQELLDKAVNDWKTKYPSKK